MEVAKLLGWRPAGDVEFKELDQFLAARASHAGMLPDVLHVVNALDTPAARPTPSWPRTE